MHGDIRVTMRKSAWTRHKHAVNVRSEIGATVILTVGGVYVDVDSVAKPLYCPCTCVMVAGQLVLSAQLKVMWTANVCMH